jgi:hypothetical protein
MPIGRAIELKIRWLLVRVQLSAPSCCYIVSKTDEQLDMLVAEKRWLAGESAKLLAEIRAGASVKDKSIRLRGRELLGRFRELKRDVQKFMEGT